MAYLRSKRPIANPHEGFMAQLVAFETKLKDEREAAIASGQPPKFPQDLLMQTSTTDARVQGPAIGPAIGPSRGPSMPPSARETALNGPLPRPRSPARPNRKRPAPIGPSPPRATKSKESSQQSMDKQDNEDPDKATLSGDGANRTSESIGPTAGPLSMHGIDTLSADVADADGAEGKRQGVVACSSSPSTIAYPVEEQTNSPEERKKEDGATKGGSNGTSEAECQDVPTKGGAAAATAMDKTGDGRSKPDAADGGTIQDDTRSPTSAQR